MFGSENHIELQTPPLRPLGPRPHTSASNSTTEAPGSNRFTCQAAHSPVQPPPTTNTSALPPPTHNPTRPPAPHPPPPPSRPSEGFPPATPNPSSAPPPHPPRQRRHVPSL